MDKGWQHNYDAGKKAFEERRYDVALQLLSQVAFEKSNYADVFNMLGLIYYYKGRFPDAVTSFQKALETNPRYTEASLNLSVVYNELGRFDKAREAYAVAKDTTKEAHSYLDPFVKGRLANMHFNLGTIYKDLGYYAQAVEEYKKALLLRPDFVDIKTELGVVYRDRRDFANSVKELAEAVELHEDYTMPRIQLGLTYYTMGQNEKARVEWKKVLEKDPEDKLAKMYMTLLMTPSG